MYADSGIVWVDIIFDWCVVFLIKTANQLGITYEEINVWLFIIIQLGLIIYFFLSSSKWKKKYLKLQMNR